MTFGREKRLLVGWIALGVALPLPLNDALDWPSLVAFVVAVVWFLRRAAAGATVWLSNRALNLLGLAYLPLLALDVLAGASLQPVRPILHLTLFGVAAKLWSLQRERDKWQAWIGVFFLFLAAMATSTHPSVLVYLLGFVALSVSLLVRFVHLHVVSAHGDATGAPPRLPLGWPVAAIVAVTVLIAVPLFALLPRVRTPFVVGPGSLGGDTTGPLVGFSDEMSLDLIGRIRDNPRIAARVRLDGVHPNPAGLRLRAATYEVWQGRSWAPVTGGVSLARDARGASFRIAPGAAVGRASIELEPLRSMLVPLPVETVAVDVAALGLTISDGGAVALRGYPDRVLEYTAMLGEHPTSPAPAPRPDGAGRGPLDRAGITPEMAALAASWAGEGSAGERAERIEARLLVDYEYSTDFVGRGGASPIEDFLLRAKRGHCEYFASAMVLLLRAEGIPARLATGFYGAEWSGWESAWIVRQSNAHAWVEAWTGEDGWKVFDPTPPDGRPIPAETGFLTAFRQAWEAAVTRWDRWVISYDFDDQIGALGGLRSWWSELMRRFAGDGEPTPSSPGAPLVPDADTPAVPAAPRRPLWPWIAAAAGVAVAGAGWLWRRRPPWTATRAYGRLRAALAGAGLPVTDALAPLALARLVERRLPAASPAASRVVSLYVREAFAGCPPDPAELASLVGALDGVDRATRAARRTRRPTLSRR